MAGLVPAMTLLSRLAQSSSTCDSECNISFGRTRGANKGADHLGILEAGRACDARGNIDTAGARHANGFRDITGIEATRDHERQFEIEIFQHVPLEYRAETAGSRGLLRGPRIEQNTIGDGSIEGQRRQIDRRLDGKSLHHLQSEFLLDVAQPRYGFPAVQLQYVRLPRLDDVGERRIGGIDRERDLYGPS